MNPLLATIWACFQTSPFQCNGGSRAVPWLSELGSGSPACNVLSLAFGGADSLWVSQERCVARLSSKAWDCFSCRAPKIISCLWKPLGRLQHVDAGKDPELQPGIQVAAMWGNSHRSSFLLACLAGSGFTGHGIHLDPLLHMGLKSL